MLTKNDCIMLLGKIVVPEDKKRLKDEMSKKALLSSTVDLDVLKFINDNRPFEVSQFYDKLRKSYNHKKSKLYGNIVKEIEDPQEVLTTLSAMLTQILLFSRDCQEKTLFLKHSRADEIAKVLTKYFVDYDISSAIMLLRLIKADLKSFEYVARS